MPLYLRKRRRKNCLLHLGVTVVALFVPPHTNRASSGRRDRGWWTIPIPIALRDLSRYKRDGGWENERRATQ